MSFADIGKNAKDLLSKDFADSKDVNKVVVNSKPLEKAALKFSSQRKGDANEASVETTANLEFGSLKTTVKPDASFTVDLEANKKLPAGLKLTAKYESAGKVNASAEYKKSNVTGKGEVDYTIEKSQYVAKVEATSSFRDFLFGGRVAYGQGAITEWGAAVQYKKNDFTAASTAEDVKGALTCSARAIYSLPNSRVVAAEVQHLSTTGKYGFTLGYQHTLDSKDVVKAKYRLDSGDLGLAYKTKLSDNARITVSSASNANDSFAKVRYGFNLDVDL